jgi:hypothetical protein
MGTHLKAQVECISSSTTFSRSFVVLALKCSSVVWFVLMSTKCVESMTRVNIENSPDL